jgi:dTDP-4-dehydrorhamnose 3,5-epimerase
MKFTPTPIEGVFVIEQEPRGDERGFFARSFCEKEFAQHKLETRFVQVNNSFSVQKGTLRGMHYQLEPWQEVKVVRCVRGRLFDVALDLREGSPTFGKHFGTELTAENRKWMYVPRGFGHGFLTLEENTEALYLVSNFYSADRERGIRWNDPRFNIAWPAKPVVLSDKDAKHRDFDPAYHLR